MVLRRARGWDRAMSSLGALNVWREGFAVHRQVRQLWPRPFDPAPLTLGPGQVQVRADGAAKMVAQASPALAPISAPAPHPNPTSK